MKTSDEIGQTSQSVADLPAAMHRSCFACSRKSLENVSPPHLHSQPELHSTGGGTKPFGLPQLKNNDHTSSLSKIEYLCREEVTL